MTGALEKKYSRQGARKSSGGSGTQYQRDSTFVDVELAASEVGEYRQWRGDVDAVDLVWREALDNGYKFTARYDDRSSAYAVFMFPDEGGDNYGYILSGRGGTPFRALAEVLYKHVFILRGDWRVRGGGADRPNDPDW